MWLKKSSFSFNISLVNVKTSGITLYLVIYWPRRSKEGVENSWQSYYIVFPLISAPGAYYILKLWGAALIIGGAN